MILMIFLGAGASVPFGIPTMNGFSDVIATHLAEVNHKWGEEFNRIKTNLQSRGLRYDIEIIATALSVFSDPSANRSYMSAFLSRVNDPLPAPIEEFKDILYEVKREIYRLCRHDNRELSIQTYRNLYKRLHDVGLTKVKSNGSMEVFDHPVAYEVFTTNYDLSFNKFLERDRRRFVDGFSGADIEGISTFTDEWLNGQNDVIRFGKLHGSISYYVRDDGGIVKYPTALHEDDMEDEGMIDNIMIYPIGEKYTTTTPYIEILSRFRKTLINEQVVIAIGFSFRDDPINNAFIDRVVRFNTRFRNFKIVLVDPDANNVIQTLPVVLRSKVTPIPMEFGNQNCLDSIVNAIQDRHPGDI
jgi:hypothetical protein